MYAQELSAHYADVRRRLNPPPQPLRPRRVVVASVEEPEPDRSQIGAEPEPASPPPPIVAIEPPAPAYPSVASIVGAVAEHYKIPVLDIISERRTACIVRPRQVAMYLAKTMTPRSLPQVGRALGHRDHTTVLHGVRRITAMIDSGDPIIDDVLAIRKTLVSE